MAASPITPPTDNPLLDHPLIKAAFAAGQQHAQNNTGISNPPDGGAVRSILPPQQEAHAMSPIQDPTAHPAVPPIGMHPQQAGLQTESPHVSSTILPPPTPSAAPAGSMQAPPSLAGPARGTIPGEEAETQRLIQTGSGASQIKNPIGRTLAEIGSGVEHIVAPGLARVTPGTEDRNQNLIQQEQAKVGLLQGQQKNDTENVFRQEQTANEESKPELAQAKSELAQEKQNETETHNRNTEGTNLRKQGLGPDGKPLGYEDLTPHEQGVIDVQKSTEELKSAQADYERFRSDPNSPQAQAALTRVQNAKSNQALGWAKLGLSKEHLAFDEDKTYNPEPGQAQRSRGDLASSSLHNIQDMRDVMKQIPAEFGPGGGRENQFKQWVGSSDPQAVKFRAASEVLSGHFAGMVGARGQYITKQLHDLTSERFNPEALNSVLDELQSTASGFKNAGTPHPKGGASGFNIPPAESGGEQETRTYQGHTYSRPKGSSSPWQLQSK